MMNTFLCYPVAPLPCFTLKVLREYSANKQIEMIALRQLCIRESKGLPGSIFCINVNHQCRTKMLRREAGAITQNGLSYAFTLPWQIRGLCNEMSLEELDIPLVILYVLKKICSLQEGGKSFKRIRRVEFACLKQGVIELEVFSNQIEKIDEFLEWFRTNFNSILAGCNVLGERLEPIGTDDCIKDIKRYAIGRHSTRIYDSIAIKDKMKVRAIQEKKSKSQVKVGLP